LSGPHIAHAVMWRGFQFWFRPLLRPASSPSCLSTTTSPILAHTAARRAYTTSTMGRGTHRVDTTKQLADLRELMLKHNVQAYVVPSQDQRAFSPDIFSSLL
jgi:hypothetical protein